MIFELSLQSLTAGVLLAVVFWVGRNQLADLLRLCQNRIRTFFHAEYRGMGFGEQNPMQVPVKVRVDSNFKNKNHR